MKEVKIQLTVPRVSAQVLFDAVYSAECLRAFHSKFNKDENASVPEWEGGIRQLSYTTPVDAPAVLKRMIGTEAIRVTEAQSLSSDASGAIIVSSVPVPDFAGADRFVTQATTSIRDVTGGCKISAMVSCTANGPYGLAGTIESFMAATAQKTLQDFWGFAKDWVEGLLASGNLAPVEPAASDTLCKPAVELAADEEEEEDRFYDAMDLLDLAALHGLRFEDAALLYMRYLCHTGDQQVAVLQSLEAQVAALGTDVAKLAASQQQRSGRIGGWLPSCSLPETLSTRQALLLAAMAATASASAALAWTTRRQRQS